MKNFGLIKEGYVALLSEAIVSQDKEMKKAFRSFVKSVKSNPILKAQKNVFKLLENVSDVEDEFKSMYISEAVDVLKNIDEEEIVTENVKLLAPLLEFGLDLTKVEYDEKNLHECITDYVYTARTPKTMNRIVESKSVILTHKPMITETKETESAIILPSQLVMIMEEKFKRNYSELNETEIKIIKSAISGNKTIQESLFNELKTECQTMVNDLKENEELVEFVDTLTQTQDKLNEMQFNEDNYVDDMHTLLELKELQKLTTN